MTEYSGVALLRRGGLLTSRKDGKQVRYRVDTLSVERSLTELQNYLRICCPPPESDAADVHSRRPSSSAPGEP